MGVCLSNQGHLRNFKNFVESLDLALPKKLEISTHGGWITLHPANLVLAAALARQFGKESAEINDVREIISIVYRYMQENLDSNGRDK